MTGYYRKVIDNLAKIIKPLTICLRKGRKVEHTKEFINAFNSCKTLLCNDSILIHPDFSKYLLYLQMLVNTQSELY